MKITADEMKEFIIKHYQYFGVGVLFICLVVVLLIFSSGKKNDDTIEAVDTVSQVSANGSEIPVPETELEKQRFDAALRRKQLSLVLAGKMKPSEATELKALFV